jgi:hypothetical protein
MKKANDNKSDSNSKLDNKKDIDSLSESNVTSSNNEKVDEFVLFPLDVQESDQNSIDSNNQNFSTSQTEDFILFPLDVNKQSNNNNNNNVNPAPIINQKGNTIKRKFVSKPNSKSNVNPKPINVPSSNYSTNKKRNTLLWILLIFISVYTFLNKKSDESYRHFFIKSSHKIANTIINIKSIFINEGDFIKFKKNKKLIFSPYVEYVENESGEINEVKGDSIIIIEPTGRSLRAYYLPKGKPFKLKIGKNEFTESERYATEKMDLDIDQNSFEAIDEYTDRVSVFLLNTGFFSQEISIHKSDIRYEDSDKIEVKYMRNRIEDYKKNITSTKFILKSLLNPKVDSIIIPKVDKQSDVSSKIKINIWERKGVSFDQEGFPIEIGNLALVQNFQNSGSYLLKRNNYIEKIEISGQSDDVTLLFINPVNKKIIHQEKNISLNGNIIFSSTDPAGNRNGNYQKWLNNNRNRIMIRIFSKSKIVFEGEIKCQRETKNNYKNKSKDNNIQDNNIQDNNIYNTSVIEVQPGFPGSMSKWYNFLQNNFTPPDEPGLKGKVVVSFVVEKDGSLTDIKVLKDIGYGSGREVERVMRKSPRWIPAEKNGRKVRCSFIQTFNIENPDE